MEGGSGPSGGVEVGTVVECVVRNAMEKLIEKQASSKAAAGRGPDAGQARKRELARYFEETRRQLVSVLALVRWQQRRLKATAQCDDLIEHLEQHREHITGTSERMCLAADETAQRHFTPMYDMRTAVDVLAAGTYRGLPTMDTERIVAHRVSESEKDEVIKQLDFVLRAQLLRMHIPPVLSKVEVSNGRLVIEFEDEFELELSLRLELPHRPFRVDRLQLLVRAVGGALPPSQGLADLLEKRINMSPEPLDEAVRILGDAVRVRTWHILHSQSQGLLLYPKVEVEASTSSFVVYYWQESPVLSFQALMSPALRASTAAAQLHQSSADGAGAVALMGGSVAAHVKGRAPCLVLASGRGMHSRVQMKHIPPLVTANGQPLDILIKRSALDLGSILDYTRKEHARCRLLLLFRCLETEGSAGLDAAGVTPHLSEAGNELIIKVEGMARLSIVVDHRSGELEVRDLQGHTAAKAWHDKLETGLHKALFKEVPGSAAQELLAWRAKDMLCIITSLAPALGLLPTTRRLLTYSHSQATQLQSIVGDKKPAVYLQVAGSGMLDSGCREASKAVAKTGAQDIWALVVQCDAAQRTYSYRLVLLSIGKAPHIGKNSKPPQAPQVVEIDPYDDEAAMLGSAAGARAGGIARDGTGCAVPKRQRGPGGGLGMRQRAALELPRVVELLLQRVNFMKLQCQLDTHNLKWRRADGVLLLSLPCAPLLSREFRLRLQSKSANASILAGGQAGWTVEMQLTSSTLPDTKAPEDVVPAPLQKGLLEDLVHVRRGRAQDESSRDMLVFSFPSVHTESIGHLRTALQGVVMIARIVQEARALLGTDATSELAKAVQRSVKLEAAGYTCLVLRFIGTEELMVIRCRAKGGLVVTLGPHPRAGLLPLVALVEVALDAGKSLASVLTFLIRAMSVLEAVKQLEACPGDITVLGYSMEAMALVFRGCYSLYIRWTLDFVGDGKAPYSLGDLCPHAHHRPLPWGLESAFMSHALHTGGNMSALADTLWCIPTWSLLVSAAAQHLAHARNEAPVEHQLAAGGSRGAGAGTTALAHVDEKRAALVCGAAQLPQLLRLLHRHMAAWHLYYMGHMFMTKVSRPSVAGTPAASAAQNKEGSITAGKNSERSLLL
jgi:hypothetical protein